MINHHLRCYIKSKLIKMQPMLFLWMGVLPKSILLRLSLMSLTRKRKYVPSVWKSIDLRLETYFDKPEKGVWKCRTQTQKYSHCRWGRLWIWGPWPPGLSWWDALREGTVGRLSMVLSSYKKAKSPIIKAQLQKCARQRVFYPTMHLFWYYCDKCCWRVQLFSWRVQLNNMQIHG